MNAKTTEITCPTCGKKDTWQTDNESRPFCSPRCKLIDLGEWADETRRIQDESDNAEQSHIPDSDEDE